MFKNVANYITSLVVLLATATIYQMTADTWLRPPHVQTVRPRADAAPTPDETLTDLFPDGAWQRGVCKRLRTDDGVLLFERWEQISEDQWKLWPITVVVGRGMSGDLDPEPIILEANEGAEIKFAQSLDVMSGGAPPIDRGRLIGKVTIRRPNKNDDDESLSIETSNLGINNRKVWTTEAIRMKFGNARIVGRDLTLFLAVSAASVPKGVGAADILDRMQLTYLDEFIMPLEDGGLWNKQGKPVEDPVRLPTTRDATPLNAMLSLHCRGRVDYDFAVDQLSLRDSISVIHHVPGQPEDRFDCEAIDLNLRNPSDQTIVRQTPLDWISRITAAGAPAVLNMPSFDAELKADRIELDAVSGLIKAGGRRGVEVRRGPLLARLAQLAYQFDPKSPKAIGGIDAFGAGIVTIADSDLMLKEMRWKKGFKVQPSEKVEIGQIDTDLQVWIDGEVEAKFADGGQFNADAIEGILKPAKKSKPTTKSQVPGFVPDRLQATGNVRVDTDAIATETEVLRLYFVDDPDPKPETVGQQKAPSALRQWVVQPGKQEATADPVARPRPVIRGDLINAQMRMTETGADARDLTVIGSVQLDHVVTTSGKTLPVKLTGEEFRLNVVDGRETLQLGSGAEAPARFEIGDGFFVGPMILIWPNENLVRIQGAGEFQMPTALLPTALMSADPNRIRWTKPPHCQWNEELRFDGKKAELTGGVDIRAAMVDGTDPWALHLMGEKLEIVMLEDVDVGQMQSIQRAAIQQITLLQSAEHPVIVNAERRAADGVLEGRHVLHAPRLTLLPSGGGKLLGDGPGWYRSWMYAPQGLMSAKQETAVASSPQLTGVHLTYHDALQGDMTNKTLAFLGGVRVGVRPIDTWKDVFDAKEMNEISSGESTVDCDRLSMAIAPGYAGAVRSLPGLPTPWEIEARSGVVFRRRTEQGLLEATAARVAYASAKDLLTVEGAPNRGAILQQTNQTGDKRRLNVKEVTIRLKDFQIIDSKIQGFSIGGLPGVEKR